MSSVEPDLAYGGAVIGVPGASAQLEYERRSTKDRAHRNSLVVEYATMAVVIGIVLAVLIQTIYHTDGLLLGAIFGVIYFLGRIAPKATTVAWSTGASGELRTATELDPLAELGYVVMHDLRMSMSRANIDHLIIGPTGVFVVETKNVRGRVQLDGREVRMGGGRLALVDEVVREVAEVRRALGPLLEDFDVSIEALVAAHRADLPWLHRTAAGIRFVYPHHLRREVTKRPVILSAQQVAELRGRAERLLPPRRHRADG